MLDFRENWLAVFAALLCMPLFLVCAFGGDSLPLSRRAIGIAFSLIVLSPAIPILLAYPFSRLQHLFVSLLIVIVILEGVFGIRPTSQLNHEGTDLIWTVVHIGFAALATIAVLIAHMVGFIQRLYGRSKSADNIG